LAAALYGIAGCTARPAGDLKSLAQGQMQKLVVETPAPAPSAGFTTADGKPLTLASFKGKVVVLNLWATWCGPCVQEMPTLAALAKEAAGQPVAVVPVSVDRLEDRGAALAFLSKRPPLPFYGDPTFGLAYAFRPAIEGLPTTVLIDRAGMVRARLSGGADWSGPDALKVVDALEHAD
jgi:thiol-disulfide isomerase/thioredoxin